MDDVSERDPSASVDVSQNRLSTGDLTLLATAIGQIGEAVVITDTSATIQYVNSAFTKMTGYSAEEAVGRKTSFLKSDRQDPAYYSELWRLILGGEVWQGELINRRKDGTHYMEVMSITPVHSPDGAITNFIAIKEDVTELRAADEALDNSAKNLEETQDIALVGTWELDVQAGEFHGSRGFFRIFDFPSGAATASFAQVIGAVHPADRDRVSKTLIGTVQVREPFDLEHRILRSDGTTRVVRTRGQVVPAMRSRSMRLVGSTLDITDGRLAHEKLRQSEEKFRSLVANIPDVTWSSTADGQRPYISPNIEQILGFASEEFSKSEWRLLFERIHPSDAKRIEQAINRLFAEGKPFDEEFRYQRKDGEWIWVHDRAYRTYERDGVRYADGVLSDITERKRVEEIRERLAAVVESSGEAIIGKTLDGTINSWNPAAEKLFGYSSSEAVGRPMRMLLPPERVTEELDILERISRGERVSALETIRVRKDGKYVDVSATISPIRNSSGAIIGASKIAHDISEHKRVEEEMRRAKETAETASRAKSEFLANMSHEIRTPMNGVIGMTKLLLDTELSAEQRRFADLVRTSGEALMLIINDILDFSKIEAKKVTLETSDFDLHSVLEDAVTLLRIKASEKQLELTCEVQPGTPLLLRGDPGRLRQILINLVGNAVKFTSRGHVAVSVRLETEELQKAVLRFSVMDTGMGFPQNHASALFEPFVQADGSSTRRYGGTGLGLTISRQLVEIMGGRIEVEARKAKDRPSGLQPSLRSEPAREPAGVIIKLGVDSSDPPVIPSATQVANRQARILLAEDNVTNREVALAMLNKLGYTADFVANGLEAVNALSSADYDLVLMDCMMPELDGFETTRRIRDRHGLARNRNPQIPIIAVTADAMNGDRDRCLRAGMNDYISKPIELRTLSEVLAKWLNAPAADHGEPPALASDSTPQLVFDEQAMLGRLMEDKLLARKVVTGFLDDAPQQLRALEKKLETSDASGARLLAHSLKGAAATVSAESLRTLCCEVQKRATASEFDRALTLMPKLNEQFELLKNRLRQLGWA